MELHETACRQNIDWLTYTIFMYILIYTSLWYFLLLLAFVSLLLIDCLNICNAKETAVTWDCWFRYKHIMKVLWITSINLLCWSACNTSQPHRFDSDWSYNNFLIQHFLFYLHVFILWSYYILKIRNYGLAVKCQCYIHIHNWSKQLEKLCSSNK